MTPVGHTLMGATIAVLAIPAGVSIRRRMTTVACFAALANLPDFALPSWGHDRYDISHSVVSLGLIIFALLGISKVFPGVRTAIGGWRIATASCLALLSHLLLDSTYNHGRGLAIFWPVSDSRLVLPLPWFETLHESLPVITSHSLRVMGIELLFYGSLLLLLICVYSLTKQPRRLR